jgi:hypothetical protein
MLFQFQVCLCCRPNEEVVELIRRCDIKQLDVDQCKVLSTLLPDKDDMQQLLAYKGDFKLLGTAEQFYMLLWKVESFRERVDCMRLQHEFAQGYNYLHPALCLVKDAAQEIEDTEELCELLSIVLVTGNFINMGGYAGNAAGFKLDSLLKMDDTRANKPRMTLTHYIVQVAQDAYPHVLDIEQKMPHVQKAARLSLDTLQSDMNDLKKSLSTITLSLEKASQDLQQHMQGFIKESECQLQDLEALMEDVHKMTERLAGFFCEDPSSFKLETLLKLISNFISRVNAAKQENIQRKQREEREEKRRLQKEEEEKKKKAKQETAKAAGKPPEASSGGCIDRLLSGIRGGFKLRQQASEASEGSSMSKKIKWSKLKTMTKGVMGAMKKSTTKTVSQPDGGKGKSGVKEHPVISLGDRETSPVLVNHSECNGGAMQPVDHSEINGGSRVGNGQYHSGIYLVNNHDESMKLSKHHEQVMAVVDAGLEVEQLQG